MVKKTLIVIAVIVGVGLGLFSQSDTNAADGGGTAAVSPTAVVTNTTGNTLTFTYTADATKDSGGLTLTVPSGWSAPQGTGGTAGYTTVSSTGTTADVFDTADTTTNWGATNHMSLAVDTGDKQEGTGSLANTITANAAANEQWYHNYAAGTTWGSAANSTNGQRVGMWIKSSVNTSSGDLSWQDDNTASLASPEDTLAIAALTANTWKYTSVTLGAARTSQRSYGLRYTTDLGAATVKLDAASVLFDAADVATNWLGDTNITVSQVGSGQEGTNSIRCTYAAAAGTGASGECYRTSTALTAVPSTTMSFWVRSSVALNAGDFRWVDDNSASLASVNDAVNLPALTANTWTYVTLTAAGLSGISVRSYGLRQIVDKGALTIDIDAMGTIIENGDATTDWTAPSATAHTIANDTGTKQEGSGSLEDTVTDSAAAGDKWYENLGATQNWSGYTTVGFWIQSSVATSSGDLQFEYDDTASLASPIGTLDIGALSANTWSWQKLTLTGTRTSVASYGIKYTTDIGAANVFLDYVLLGPGSPTFTGAGPWDVNVVFLALASSQTVTITYGSGGGTSGASAPNAVRTDTFTTKDRDAITGTLTAISASPTVLINGSPAVGTVSDAPDPVNVGSNVTFSSGTWTDSNSGDTMKLFVCKTNSLTSQATGGCAGGAWYSGSSYTSTNPQTGDYTAVLGDVATSPNNYYVFVCDSNQVSNSCSASGSGTFSAINGSLSVGIVDGAGSPVASPSVGFGAVGFSFATQTGTGTLGVAAQKIRVTNTTGTPAWSLSIAATSGPTTLWTTGSVTYDFNSTAANGRLTVDPSGATNTPQGGCATTGITLGSSTPFNQGVTDSITLATAGGSTQTNCYWDFTDIALTQDIPATQAAGTYTINLTLTAA